MEASCPRGAGSRLRLSPPRHFCRAFKKAFGLPPMAYQQQLRTQAAATLLRETPLRIGEIARRTGYSDVYAFSKAFRRNTGLSFRAFRRSTSEPFLRA